MSVLGASLDVDSRRVCEDARMFARSAYRSGPRIFAEARVVYLARLVRECFREAFQDPRLVFKDLRERCGFSLHSLERAEAQIDERVVLPPVRAWDPVLVGWAFQAWGEPMRDEASWGVSYAEEESAEYADIEALTQIFTDGYIADFLVRSCWESPRVSQVDHIRICDPGCGTGHLLIAAIRDLASKKNQMSCELYGFDIDALAVDVCRALLLIEHIRLGMLRDLRVVWRELESRIVTLPGPLGILDRAMELPRGLFDVVLANPPYLGRRKMPGEMRAYLDTHYPATKIDLCAAFLQRCVEMLVDGGVVGFVASDKWLRLGGYRGFRGGHQTYRGFLREVALSEIVELGARAFTSRSKMHDGVRVAAVIGRKEDPLPSHEVGYLDLSQLATYEDKVRRLGERRAGMTRDVRLAQNTLIDSDVGSPFLQASELPSNLRTANRVIADVAQVVVGLQTNDDDRFVRYVWEVPPDRSRWKVHSKGSGYGRWYGHNQWVLDWEGGKRFFFKSRETLERAESWVAQAGWCYGWFANGSVGLRRKESGWTFGRAASSGVFCDDVRIISFLNSRWASLCVRYIGGKMQIPEGVVRRVPMPDFSEMVSSRLVEAAVKVKRRLIEMDPSDVVFQPDSSRAWRDEYVLQALLLLIEGALEAQIERALQMSHNESDRLARRYGVPAAWLQQVTAEMDEEFWEMVPREYAWLQEILRGDSRSDSIPAFRDNEFSATEIIMALQKRGAVGGDPWILPIASQVERVSRLLRLHPIHSVLTLFRGAATNDAVYAAVAEPLVLRETLTTLLGRLGHRWWSEVQETKRVPGPTLSQAEAARLILQSSRDEKICGGRERDVTEWLRGRFSDWHTKVFRQRSPLNEKVNFSGETFYSHRWDERDEEPII